MRQLLFPTATIKIQKAGDVQLTGPAQGNADFFILPIADQERAGLAVSTASRRTVGGKRRRGMVASCEVQFSTTVEGTAVVATFEVANLHPNTVRAMAREGFIKIEAGYLGHPTRPPQLIFFGRLDSAPWSLDGGQIRWKFSATALPSEIWAIRPRATQPIASDGTPQKILIGEAIRVIADRIGIGRANVRLPAIFDGSLVDTDIKATATSSKATETFLNAITLERWTTTRTAIEEVQDLMQRVTIAVQQSFGIVRNYSLLPDVNDPFLLVIDDVTRYSGEILNLNLDSSQIISSGPVENAAVAPPTDTSADGADAGTEAPNQVVQVQEFKIVSVFDPKVSMGLLVRGRSTRIGIDLKFKVTKGKHVLNGSPLKWRTEYSGPTEPQVETEVARG